MYLCIEKEKNLLFVTSKQLNKKMSMCLISSFLTKWIGRKEKKKRIILVGKKFHKKKKKKGFFSSFSISVCLMILLRVCGEISYDVDEWCKTEIDRNDDLSSSYTTIRLRMYVTERTYIYISISRKREKERMMFFCRSCSTTVKFMRKITCCFSSFYYLEIPQLM